MTEHGAKSAPAPRRNADADWDRWPVQNYLGENYRELHAADAQVIRHHSAFFAPFPPGSLARCLELGPGPNLYPLMLLAGAAVSVDAFEPSSANCTYLRAQKVCPDASWQPFYTLCRSLNPALPATLPDALDKVRVRHAGAASLPDSFYDLASMHFVAESVTEDPEEFAALCGLCIRSVRPGGYLVAAFMETMPSYRIKDSAVWPALPVDVRAVADVFSSRAERLDVTRVPKDLTLPDYGDNGMILLTAVRKPATTAS